MGNKGEYGFAGCWRGKCNYGVVAKNVELGIFIVLADCKFGMVELDVKRIIEWVKGLRKPIVDSRKTNARLLPLLRIVEPLNLCHNGKLRRNVT